MYWLDKHEVVFFTPDFAMSNMLQYSQRHSVINLCDVHNSS